MRTIEMSSVACLQSRSYTVINRITHFFICLLVSLSALHSFAQVAPVANPAGGFAIDGGLRSNTPISPSPFAINQGDWFPGAGGTGGSVFNSAGVAFDPARSGKATDNFNSGDNIFTTGSKFNDYISALSWTINSAPDKN